MVFATVRDLQNSTSRMLRTAAGGQDVLVTSHGKPIAVIHGLRAENLEDYVLTHSPAIRKKLEAAERELARGEAIPLSEICAQFGVVERRGRGKPRR